MSVVEVAARVRAGSLSASALTATYLKRIDAFDAPLNAYRTVTLAAALERAREIDETVDRGEDPGALAGVPVALKDNIAVSGVALTASSSLLCDNVARSDATVTSRLRAAGAVILGKLHMSEWAIGATTQNIHFGAGHNPWDPERVPGGSSGGSGIAIAADLALATLGTDTGGSCRLPAALNGVVGLRPTFGRVSNAGSIPVSWSLDTIGPLARRAEDIAAVLAVIAGPDDADPTTESLPVPNYLAALELEPQGLRVGVVGGSFREKPLGPAVGAALDRAASDLARTGIELDAVTIEGQAEMIEVTADLMMAEAAAYHARRLAESPNAFADDVVARLRRGQRVTGSRYGEARQRARVWRRQVDRALQGRDALLVPASPIVAPRIVESDPLTTTAALSCCTSVWVTAGVPALTVPVGFVEGLPVAMQLIGRRFEDETLLRIAHAYQQVTGWHLQRPQLSPSACSPPRNQSESPACTGPAPTV